MPVYVDDYRTPFRRMIMSHMTADTLDELHDMARKLNLNRRYFQDGSTPHYDVCESMRRKAVQLGAIEETTVEGVLRRKEQRDGNSTVC